MTEKFKQTFNNGEASESESQEILARKETIGSVHETIVEEWQKLQDSYARLEQSTNDPVKIEQGKTILQRAARGIFSITKKLVATTALGATLAVGYTAIDVDREMPFVDKEKAEKELADNGIPSDQQYSAYKAGISEFVYNAVTPIGYQENVEPNGFMPNLFTALDKLGVPNAGMMQGIIPNALVGREERGELKKTIQAEWLKENEEVNKKILEKYNCKDWTEFDTKSTRAMRDDLNGQLSAVHEKYRTLSQDETYSDITNVPPGQLFSAKDRPGREDSWCIYLGLPQKHGTFGVSDFKPSAGKEDKYYFKINNFWNDFNNQLLSLSSEDHERIAKVQFESNHAEGDWSEVEEMLSPKGNLKGKIEMVKKYGVDNKLHFVGTGSVKDDKVLNDHIMGNYTFGLGEDEHGSYVYYYDNWDLASAFAENPVLKGVGKPYEIYDRLYYDPVTFEVQMVK